VTLPPPAGPRPKAVLFDWDNTLVDTWTVIHETLNVTLTKFGHQPWTIEQTREQVRHSMRDSFPALFGDKWKEAGEVFYEYFETIHLDRLQPLPGAKAMLEDLDNMDVYLGVVSNKVGEYLRQEAAHLGWDSLFGQIVGAFDADSDKPASDPVHLALTGSGIVPGPGVWFAGDAGIDLECAVKAGCVPVLVRQVAPKPGEFEDNPPVWYFRECQALSNLIKSM